jgi:hypothetical protein
MRHDLGQRQGSEVGLVAGDQDPPALLVAQKVRRLAVAAFTANRTAPKPAN